MDEDQDGLGHGTEVAGIIGALTDNVLGIAGINWGTKIVVIRVATNRGQASEFDVAEGIFDALDRGVYVINISIAFPNDNLTLRNAIQATSGRVIVVAAVKNSTTTGCFMGFPAAYFGVISVAATNQNDVWSSGCTGNIKDGVRYQGLQLTAPGRDIYTLRMNNGLGYDSGTSFSAAFVSGVASILMDCISPTDTSFDLILGSDDLGSPGWDITYGYGRLNLYKALLRTCF